MSKLKIDIVNSGCRVKLLTKYCFVLKNDNDLSNLRQEADGDICVSADEEEGGHLHQQVAQPPVLLHRDHLLRQPPLHLLLRRQGGNAFEVICDQ